jgi:pyruvate dehydrogenase E2 component (dihydrolipoamide acetyltransferase)
LPANVIMPALEMAQDTGRLIRWLKREGETVRKGEPLMEIETDKVTVEIEATSTGILRGVSATEGEEIPVGQVIAQIVAPGEELGPSASGGSAAKPPATVSRHPPVKASVLAQKIATEHNLDLSLVKSNDGRIEKADVLAYLAQNSPQGPAAYEPAAGILPASPKARRLAKQQGVDLATVKGSGPQSAVLAADMLAMPPARHVGGDAATPAPPAKIGVSHVWRIMAERMSASWTTAPHFYLVRQVKAAGLVEIRAQIAPAIEKRTGLKPTYTDILVKFVASVLRDHPRLNARWTDDGIHLNPDINVGVATATDDGLVVPVIHKADALSIGEIVSRRQDLVTRAGDHQLHPPDIADGTFTLSNLGMYGVDAFSAIVNPPQAAILAVGRIAEQVVPENGEPVVRPMLILTLSCDHRVVDGARAAIFLNDLASLIETPWQLLA